MNLTITRRLEFDAGHRLLDHEGKCAHYHGHRYVAEIEVSAKKLDPIGRVIDFSKVKEIVGGWIDSNWDHNMILHFCDGNATSFEHTGKKPFLMRDNPTAENMVQVLASVSEILLAPHHIQVVSIRLYETPNCFALWKAGEERSEE